MRNAPLNSSRSKFAEDEMEKSLNWSETTGGKTLRLEMCKNVTWSGVSGLASAGQSGFYRTQT